MIDFRRWTPEEKQFLRDNYGKLTQNELARQLNRSQRAVAARYAQQHREDCGWQPGDAGGSIRRPTWLEWASGRSQEVRLGIFQRLAVGVPPEEYRKMFDQLFPGCEPAWIDESDDDICKTYGVKPPGYDWRACGVAKRTAFDAPR
jgi:hypothetical protein